MNIYIYIYIFHEPLSCYDWGSTPLYAYYYSSS